MLSKWWVRRYNLPSNHELFQSRTLFEHLTDFWEDHFANTPLAVYKNEQGEVQFSETGDSMIDKWEKELAEGKTPDYMEAFSEEQLAKLDRLRKKGTDRFNRPVARATIRDAAKAAAEEAASIEGLSNTTPPVYRRFGMDPNE